MTVESAEIWSVSQLTRRVKNLLEREIATVWVAGEISNFRVSPAGHAYFTLKDDESQLDAVMFRGKLMRLPFTPESGLEVIVRGLVTVYERRGNYQIVCDEMQPKGMGALQLAFEKLKTKLRDEGLFDEAHKKPIPMLPRRIGIVTSPTGAAIRDILNVLERRFANVHVLLAPARVQGDEAKEEIVEAIRRLDDYGVDAIIVGRGGGSLEDLWAFNEELVVRAVYEVNTPIISAVGHEIDYALTDFAADLRAPTPSAAAELVVREHQALLETVRQLRQRLTQAMHTGIETGRRRVEMAKTCYVFRRPEDLIRERRLALDDLRMRTDNAVRDQTERYRVRLDQAARSLGLLSPAQQLRRSREHLAALERRLGRTGRETTEAARNRLRPLAAQLEALSPLKILSRGYAVVRKLPDRTIVRDAPQLAPGDNVLMTFGTGSAEAAVTRIEEGNDG